MTAEFIRSTSRIEAALEISLVREGKYWSAVSPALNVSGYGKTVAEAKASFKIEMDLLFEEALEKGTLHRLLLDYGWMLLPRDEASV